jgi:4a-hydroxytetrahydrobiopterin dehydratase
VAVESAQELLSRRCKPCEGGVEPISPEEAREQAAKLEGWSVSENGKAIGKRWKMRNFVAALEFFRLVGDLAEAEQHHPDLHLRGYREAAIEISTHAIGGLSENDFILAAKIDRLSCDGTPRT